MRKITYLLLLLSTQIGFCQTDTHAFEKMVDAERKSASKTINLAVNPNTLNYDITYHKLEFTVDPTVFGIAGKVTTTFKALSDLSTVTFDMAESLLVSSVTKDAIPLTFIQNTDDELVITLPATQLTGTTATVEIIYEGEPANSGFNSFVVDEHGPTNSPVLWTLSEPYGARDWWPCKQDLNDKVDNGIDVYITAPSEYISVSNGIEPEAPVINGLNKTTHFRHSYPIPAYLIAIAVTNYQIHNQQAGLGTVASPHYPVINYIYPETSGTMIPSIAVTPSILNLYETLIGTYPFRNEKYGHAEFHWGGGMEHTTVSFMTADINGTFTRSLIAHEMAHQWFGDKVTCGSWKDIWLNEGITEYMSGLVVENFDGQAAFTSWKNAKTTNITAVPTGNLYLFDSQLTNINRIFSSRLTYNKGAMVANMLRFKMGDANFFQALQNYLNDPTLAYAYALTPQFQAKLEAVHGSSLQEFFNDWVYNEGYPTYAITAFNSGVNQATIQINQTQSITNSAQIGYVSFFEMPVPVRLTGDGGEQLDVVLDHTFSGQSFQVSVPFTVTGVQFDPNKNIISKNSTAILGADTFVFNNAIQLFPNPSSDDISISLPNHSLLLNTRFYNTLGQNALESNRNRIDVSKLAKGVYVVTLETSEGTYHKKFIKK